MNERHLYRGFNKFEGSIDEDGNLYDERHSRIGRIEGNVIYDNCNIKQGRIDESGKLWDVNYMYVGEAHGNNFIGPTYQSTGVVRGVNTVAVLQAKAGAWLKDFVEASARPGFNMTSYLGVDAIEAVTWYDSLTAA